VRDLLRQTGLIGHLDPFTFIGGDPSLSVKL
jgi:hypothetical protein